MAFRIAMIVKIYFRPPQALILLSLLSCCANAQVKNEPADSPQKFIKTKSLNKGDNVHCSLQDRNGNIWFGTTGDGIYKYDGKLFTQYTSTNGLNSNTVWCMLEDKEGKIWIGTNDGLCVYDKNKLTKVSIGSIPTDKDDIWSIMQDKSGRLWLATGTGVYQYDGKLYTPFKVTDDTSSCIFKMEYILEDKKGNFWFGGRCHKGVYRFDGKSITNLKPNGENWVWPVLEDRNGNIWFSNWKGAYRYNGETFTSFTEKDGLADEVVTRIIEDKNGNLWFGGGGGISRFDGTSFTLLPTKDGLGNRGIWMILEDRTGRFWIGTTETSLYRYDGKTFIKFSE